MTRSEINVALSAILTTALETEPTAFPESTAYLALGSDMTKWELVKSFLLAAELATIEENKIVLTNKGRDIARQCQQVQKVA